MTTPMNAYDDVFEAFAEARRGLVDGKALDYALFVWGTLSGVTDGMHPPPVVEFGGHLDGDVTLRWDMGVHVLVVTLFAGAPSRVVYRDRRAGRDVAANLWIGHPLPEWLLEKLLLVRMSMNPPEAT